MKLFEDMGYQDYLVNYCTISFWGSSLLFFTREISTSTSYWHLQIRLL